jgi:hypothetical protein
MYAKIQCWGPQQHFLGNVPLLLSKRSSVFSKHTEPLGSGLCTFLTVTPSLTLDPSILHVHCKKSFGIYKVIDLVTVNKQA